MLQYIPFTNKYIYPVFLYLPRTPIFNLYSYIYPELQYFLNTRILTLYSNIYPAIPASSRPPAKQNSARCPRG